MQSTTEVLREALERARKKQTPRIAGIKRCSANAKTRLFREKKKELRLYYEQECANAGVSMVKQGGAVPEGEPAGRDRYKITMQARSVAQTKIRKEFYERYLEIYSEELILAGIEPNKERWSSVSRVEKLEAEVARLETLLATCKCKGRG